MVLVEGRFLAHNVERTRVVPGIFDFFPKISTDVPWSNTNRLDQTLFSFLSLPTETPDYSLPFWRSVVGLNISAANASTESLV